MEDINKVEAVLFVTGKFMNVDEIARAAGFGSTGYVKELIDGLKKRYEDNNTGLAIHENEGKYKLNIKKEYGELANKLVSSSEFDNPTTKTLAIIAYKQPIFQAEVIKIRGNKAYDHIKRLLENELVTSEKSGRTRILKVTGKFYNYFDTAEEKVKEEFNMIRQAIQAKEINVENAQNEIQTGASDEGKILKGEGAALAEEEPRPDGEGKC